MLGNKLKNEFKRKLKAFYFDQLGLLDWEERAEARIEGKYLKSYINGIQKHIKLDSKKILDVGSGWGDILISMKSKGAYFFCLEPDKEKVRLSKLLSKNIKKRFKTFFLISDGENLPLKTAVFDVVLSHSVLEHVRCPSIVIKEMIRVTKSDGFCFIHTPNYLYPHEHHYKIKWIPLMPKLFGKVYLILKDKNPSFLNNINFNITSIFFQKELRKYDLVVHDLCEKRIKDQILLKNIPFGKKLLIKLHLPKIISLFYPVVFLKLKRLH